MKHKTFILAGLCALGLSTWEVQAINLNSAPVIINGVEQNMPNEFEKIDLLGDLLYSVGPNAIEAGASDDAVYIQFNQSFGSVSITIYNSSNLVVYSTVVDTSVQQVAIIPFANASADAYTIVLNHADDYAEGDFEKN